MGWLFNRHKNPWKENDIHFALKDDEPVFWAFVALKLGPEKPRYYREKDLEFVDKILGQLQRREVEHWELKEEIYGKDDPDNAAYVLYFYPCKLEKLRREREKAFYFSRSTDLERVLFMFNQWSW